MTGSPSAGGSRDRLAAMGGIAGPVAFAGAWAVLGTRLAGYSPVDDPISRLAAAGAATRPAMTAGLVAYAAGVLPFASMVRTELPRSAVAALALSAVGSLGVAATPLDSAWGGTPHAVAAGITYSSLAAAPLLSAREPSTRRATGPRAASIGIGLACGACLALSATGAPHTGLWQRLGLTIGHAWVVGAAVRSLRHPRRLARPRPMPRA